MSCFGQCPPITCPPTTIPPTIPPTSTPAPMIDCLKVKKVFEECSSTFVARVRIPVCTPVPGNAVACGSANIRPRQLLCDIIPGCSIVRIVDNDVTLHVRANLIQGTNVFPVEAFGTLIIPEDQREFVLSRAGEEDLDCEVEIFAECLECFISCISAEGIVSEITCCIGILIIVKLVAEVQLLIPTFGFCPVPPKCTPTPPCVSEFNPTSIPFPLQIPLQLPPPPAFCTGFFFTVRPGDTLFSISQMFGVPLAALIAANPQITNPNVIFPGQVICIPAAALPPTSCPPTGPPTCPPTCPPPCPPTCPPTCPPLCQTCQPQTQPQCMIDVRF